MTRIAPLTTSLGVGSVHVGLKDLNGSERRATFHIEANSPFFAEIFATNNFDFTLNVGSNWRNVTPRIFLDQGKDDPDFEQINGNKQRLKKKNSSDITAAGMYVMDEGFMPAAFSINITSVTPGDPISIFFGV